MFFRLLAGLLLFAGFGVRGEEFFTGKPHSGWWFKEIKCEHPAADPVWFGGTLKCENAFPPAAGTQEQEFGVSVVLKYDNGAEDWNPFARWDPGTHDWQETQSVYYPKKPVKAMILRIRADPGPGVSQYKDIFIRRTDPGPSVARWRCATERPFADEDYLHVTFPVPTDWKSECGARTACGRAQRIAKVPVGPEAGTVKLVLERGGKRREVAIGIPAADLPCNTVGDGGVAVWTEDSAVAVTPLSFPKTNATRSVRIALVRRASASAQILASTGPGRSLDGVALEIGKLALAGNSKKKSKEKK